MARAPSRRSATAWSAVALSAGLVACQGRQSVLDPAADDAARLATMSWILFGGATAIFVGVFVLTLVAVALSPERRRWLGTRRTIIAGGVIFPVLTLTALFTYGLFVLRDTNAPSDGALRLEVVGEQYWWRVRYPAEDGQPDLITANEVQLPVGRPVTISVTAADVIHSFWIPNFGGKIDMIPGRVNTLSFTAQRPGVYRGICTEFCGDQHARMAFDVVALEPADFAAWRAAQARAAPPVASAFLRQGAELFVRGGCGNCHAVRGTQAAGVLGPDLTHVGSRRSIGAASYPNNVGTLAGWIADTQHLKQGARMPSYGGFTGEELRSLAGYLEQLK